MKAIIIGILIGLAMRLLFEDLIKLKSKFKIRLHYGLSKKKMVILDDVIDTYKAIYDDIYTLDFKQPKIPDIIENIAMKTINTAYDIGGERAILYIKEKTNIGLYEIYMSFKEEN